MLLIVPLYRGSKSFQEFYHSFQGLHVSVMRELMMMMMVMAGEPRKVDIKLSGKGNSNFHGSRPVYQNHLDD